MIVHGGLYVRLCVSPNFKHTLTVMVFLRFFRHSFSCDVHDVHSSLNFASWKSSSNKRKKKKKSNPNLKCFSIEQMELFFIVLRVSRKSRKSLSHSIKQLIQFSLFLIRFKWCLWNDRRHWIIDAHGSFQIRQCKVIEYVLF